MRHRYFEEQRGFTLIEITVALVAGLFVAMALMTLAKELGASFQEETRVASTESALRAGINRLRSDLQRTSFMSTGNIRDDVEIARDATSRMQLGPLAEEYHGLRALAGLHLMPGAELPLSNINRIAPDSLVIGGNFTTTDVFPVEDFTRSARCDEFILWGSSPAIARATAGLATAPERVRALNQLFQPAGENAQFLVRFTDRHGLSVYVPTCREMPAIEYNGAQQFVLRVTAGMMLDTVQTDGHGGWSGQEIREASVNPVQIVQWIIQSWDQLSGNEQAAYAVLGVAVERPTKYYLMRRYLNLRDGLTGVGIGELISEFAVDLRFSFTVDRSNGGGRPILDVFDFDEVRGDQNNANWAGRIDGRAGVPNMQPPGPQRIRSVKVRLSVRAALADRSADLGVNTPRDGHVRYCLNVDGCRPGWLEWARVRNVMTEVALPNQAHFFY